MQPLQAPLAPGASFEAAPGASGATAPTAQPAQQRLAAAPRLGAPSQESAAAQRYYGSWAYGTFGCCSEPLYSCFFCCCYPCALVLRVSTIVEKVGAMDVPILGAVDKKSALVYGVLALLFAWLGALPYLLFVFLMYKGLQARFAITGEGDLAALCKVCCCPCCTWIKVGRHVDAYSEALAV